MSGLATKYTYTDVSVPEHLITGELKHVSPLAIKIAYKRGYQTTEDLTEFFFGSLSSVLKENKMRDTDKALTILKEAVKEKKKIVVYQDYDVDGVSSAALVLSCIRNLGGNIESYVNMREEDGYGICTNGIDHILQKYPDARVILTVDNGIVANEAVAYAKSKGLQVIVTDHHLPAEQLPAADAVIDPKRADEFYPFHELCGTGVAFKLMLELYDYMGKDPAPVLGNIDLVGMATVADIVPLVSENRVFVREALVQMNKKPRPSIEMMKELCEIDEVTSHTIGFVFGPMINALSRMGEDSYLATELLLSKNYTFLRERIEFLIENNKNRKQETKEEEEIALSMVDEKNLPSAIVLFHEFFQEGIIGIVAGRLKEEYNRPVVVFAPSGEEGVLKASCRSTDAFHLKDNLDKIADSMLGYGGHAKAAGLSIKRENFDLFKTGFLKLTDRLDPDCFKKTKELDVVIGAEDVSVDQIKSLRILEPYGEKNPKPIFGLTFQYDYVRYFGENDKHVRYIVKNNNLAVIEWGGGSTERARQARGVKRSKVVGSMNLNEFRGSITPQFIVK